MGHRNGAGHASTSRGNRRTRSGPGRHNLRPAHLRSPYAGLRICLGCNRPFKSNGPWNRFCGRCHLSEDEEEAVRHYHVPGEWPNSVIRDADEF